MNEIIRLAKMAERLSGQFESFWGAIYKKIPGANPVSDHAVDKSTRFIGSATNIFKTMMLNGSAPEHGGYVVQRCFSSRNLEAYKQPIPNFYNASTHECHGVLSAYSDFPNIVRALDTYFNEVMGLADQVRYVVHSSDAELTSVLEDNITPIRLRKVNIPIKNMRHSFGDSRLEGKDIWLHAMDKRTNRVLSIGVLILILVDHQPKYMELSLSPGRFIQLTNGLAHFVDIYGIQKIKGADPLLERAFSDCLTAVATLIHFGLRPGGTDNRMKILRQYIKCLSTLSGSLGLSHSSLLAALRDFEVCYYKTSYSSAVLEREFSKYGYVDTQF